MARPEQRIILGIDPGLANTGWGIIKQLGGRMYCLAYGCISTPADMELSKRLQKLHDQMALIVERYNPTCLGIEIVYFGANTQSALATGQARGAVLVACAEHDLRVKEFNPLQIKYAVTGEGRAEKAQVQYMVKQILGLEAEPKPDHAADALAAAICYVTHEMKI